MPKETGDLKTILDEAYAEAVKDAKELRDAYLRPVLKMGKNRIISAATGAKTGFLAGLKGGALWGGHGIVVSTIFGAAAGLTLGPKAAEKIEGWLGPEEDNENTPVPENKEKRNKSSQDKPPPP